MCIKQTFTGNFAHNSVLYTKKVHEWIDSQENKKCYLTCDNIKVPGTPRTPFEEVLEAYSENTVLNHYALKLVQQ